MGSISDIAELIPKEYRSNDLTETEKLIRRAFVHEYLRDYNATNAALRCGYDIAFAAEVAEGFLRETYTQRIKLNKEEESPTVERQVEICNVSFNRLFGEAGAAYNNAQVRVAATGNLLKMLGADSPTGKPSVLDDEVQGGVMVVPEMPGDSKQWETKSHQSQKKLKEEVRE